MLIKTKRNFILVSLIGTVGLLYSKLDTGSFIFNNIIVDMENNGMLVSHRITGHSGMEWPNGSNKYIDFAAGIWFAGKVGNDIRTAVSQYGPEFKSGPFGSDAGWDLDRFYYITKLDLDNPTTSQDIIDWPWMQGAPWIDANNDGYYDISDGDLPDMHGDFMVWYIANDADTSGHKIFDTDPLNIEMSILQWGYTEAFNNVSLQNMIFTKVQFINKGKNQIDDMYISLWDDPDLGNAGDDFVGCDTTLSLGYCYNDGSDSEYGDNPPSIGRVFLQGPIVESTGDTAVAFGTTYIDHRNLPMSSFTKYINGDPVYTDPSDKIEAYYYMSGYKRDGTAFIDSETNQETKFVNPCDPNGNTGAGDGCWVDSDDHASGDRRFLMNMGPFNMSPGEEQEIIFATIISQGNGPLNSISHLKEHANIARQLYENDFNGTSEITFAHYEISNPIILADNLNHDGNWNNGETILLNMTIKNPTDGDLSQTVCLISSNSYTSIIDESSRTITLAPFEQININELSWSPYISLSRNYSISVVNLIVSVTNDASSEVHFTDISLPVYQLGFQPDVVYADHIAGSSDAGLGYIIVDYSALRGHEYEVFFAEYDSEFNSGNDNEFDDIHILSRSTNSVWGINLMDITTNELLLQNHPIPNQLGFDMPVTHGFKLNVDGIANGIHGIFMVHDGVTAHPEYSDFGYAEAKASGGRPVGDVLQSSQWLNSPAYDYAENSNGGYYFATQGGGTAASETSYYERVFRGSNFSVAMPYDFEMRFTAGGGKCSMMYSSMTVVDVPFELWNVGISTPDDASDDYQMMCWIYDTNGSGTYDWHGDLEDSGALDDPGTDYVYWRNPNDTSPGTAGYDAAVAANYDYATQTGVEVMARTIWNNWNGDGSKVDSVAVTDLSNVDPANWTAADMTLFNNKGFFINTANSVNSLAGVFTDSGTSTLAVAGTAVSGYVYANVILFPAEGSIYRWVTNKGISKEDKFSFTTPGEQYPPVAHFELISSEGIYGEPVIFDASSSYDTDGDDLTFNWSCEAEYYTIFFHRIPHFYRSN